MYHVCPWLISKTRTACVHSPMGGGRVEGAKERSHEPVEFFQCVHPWRFCVDLSKAEGMRHYRQCKWENYSNLEYYITKFIHILKIEQNLLKLEPGTVGPPKIFSPAHEPLGWGANHDVITYDRLQLGTQTTSNIVHDWTWQYQSQQNVTKLCSPVAYQCTIPDKIDAWESIWFYRPRMREGNVFILCVCVCMYVCVCVCLCVCLFRL